MDQSPRQQDDDSAGSPDMDPASPEKPEKVEDRPNVSTVTPEDYPPDQRAGTFNEGQQP